MTISCVYLLILRSFSEDPFKGMIHKDCSFHLQVAIFKTIYAIKKIFHRYFSSFLYKSEKYPFEDVHLMKIPFLETHRNCFFQRGFESLREEFILENIFQYTPGTLSWSKHIASKTLNFNDISITKILFFLSIFPLDANYFFRNLI